MAGKAFAQGDAVLYDNTRTGAMEMATVVAVHADASPPSYTVLVGGHEIRTDGGRLTRRRSQAAAKASSWDWSRGGERGARQRRRMLLRTIRVAAVRLAPPLVRPQRRRPDRRRHAESLFMNR